jgi:tripartite ATP-independent transporter DctM subunit
VVSAVALLCRIIAAAALVADLALVSIAVLCREALQLPMQWADDVARILLVVLVFFGAAAGLAQGGHLGIQALTHRLSATVQSVIRAGTDWIVLAVAAGFCVFGALYCEIAWDQITSTGLPHNLFLFPLIGGGAAMVVIAGGALRRHSVRSVAIAAIGLTAIALLAALWLSLVPQFAPRPLWIMIAAFTGLLALGVPIAYALAAGALAFLLADGTLPLAVFAQQASSGIDNFVLLSIPFFILTGVVMELNGMSTRLIHLLRRAVGSRTSGLGITTILGMVLFSGVSGSKAADVTAVGTVIVPAMRRARQDPSEGVAILASSAVMAETIPPCINLIILGYVGSLSIGGLFAAGIVPALFMALALIAVVVLAARNWPQPFVERDEQRLGTLLLGGLVSLGVIAIIFIGYRSGFATATEIGVFATIYAIVAGAVLFREFGLRAAVEAFVRSAVMSGSILFVIAAAQTAAFSLTIDRVPQDLANAIVAMTSSFGPWSFLVLSILLLIVMGAALEGAPALIIFGPLLLPVAQSLGIDPLHYGIVLIVAMGLGLFSPPLGIGLYISCAVGGVPIEQTVRPILKYLAVLFVCLLVIAFLPEMTLALPRSIGMVR